LGLPPLGPGFLHVLSSVAQATLPSTALGGLGPTQVSRRRLAL